MLDELRSGVEGYFRAYYSELRKHIAVHDPEFRVLPHWFKGGREVHTVACKDGVVVVHWPYDKETMTFPDREDSYRFYVQPSELVKERVAEYDFPWMNPSGLPANMQPLIRDYVPGEEFESGYWPEPRRSYSPLDSEGNSIIEADTWTRLDYTDMRNLDTWRDVPWAREQARFILRRYLEIA